MMRSLSQHRKYWGMGEIASQNNEPANPIISSALTIGVVAALYWAGHVIGKRTSTLGIRDIF